MEIPISDIVQQLIDNQYFDTNDFRNIKKENFDQFLLLCDSKSLSLKKWHQIATQFYENKMIDKFLDTINFIKTTQIDHPRNNYEELRYQKIDIYISLAVYHLQLAIQNNDVQKQQEELKEVIKYIEQNCMKLEQNYSLIHSLRGFLKFYIGDMEQAKENFKTARMIIEGSKQDNEKKSFILYLGLAQVEFANRNYAESLKHFKKALQGSPGLPASVRLGMGICFYMLKKYSMAQKAFERTLELQKDNSQALYGLALLAYLQKNYDVYFERLQQAFEIDQNDPIILLHLAEHYLINCNYSSVKKLVNRALISLKQQAKFLPESQKKIEFSFRNDQIEIKSRLFLVLGQMEHKEGRFETAIKFYTQAVKINRNNFVAQYCLSQIYIHPFNQHYGEALNSIKFIAEKISAGDNKEFLYEMYKQLGYLHGKQMQNREESFQYYKKTLQYDNSDYESYIEYGSMLIDTDLSESLNCYLKAKDILIQAEQKGSEINIQPELFNNIGALQISQNQSSKAIKMLEQGIIYAQKQLEKNGDEFKFKCYECTLYFNLGCAYIELNNMEMAEKYFKQVLEINPYHLDTYNRLGFMYYQMGQSEKSLETLEEALTKFTDVKCSKILRIDSILDMKGYILKQLDDDKSAKVAYDSISKKFLISDGYANLSLMHIDYTIMCQNRQLADYNQKVLRCLQDFVKRILEQEPGNIQAAHILSVVLAEFGAINQAKELLGQLREFSTQNMKILFNLGQVEFLQQKYESAISFYKKYLQNIQCVDEYAETQLSLAYLLQQNYQQASNVMKKLIMRNPSEIQHRFNLNVILHEQSEEIIQKKDKKEIKETQKSLEYLKNIMDIYDYIAHNPKCRMSRLHLITIPTVREKKKPQLEQICERSDEKSIFIRSHQDSFDKYLREAQELYIQHLKIKEDKRKSEQLAQLIKQKELDEEKDRIEKQKQLDRQMYEEMKQQQEKVAEIWKENNLHKQIPEKKLKSKKQQQRADDTNKNINISDDESNKDVDVFDEFINDDDDQGNQQIKQESHSNSKDDDSLNFKRKSENDIENVIQSSDSEYKKKKSKKQKQQKEKIRQRLKKVKIQEQVYEDEQQSSLSQKIEENAQEPNYANEDDESDIFNEDSMKQEEPIPKEEQSSPGDDQFQPQPKSKKDAMEEEGSKKEGVQEDLKQESLQAAEIQGIQIEKKPKLVRNESNYIDQLDIDDSN